MARKAPVFANKLRQASHVNVSVILDHDDRRKIAAFYAILINVDKRVSSSRKNSKAKKTKTKEQPIVTYITASSTKVRLKSGPSYLYPIPVSLCK